MNSKSYSILTKEMINNDEHNGSIPENCFCPVCNVHMNRVKRSRPLDTHQEHNAYSSDGIKERLCPVDRLQTLRTSLHPTMDHSSERLLKLTPYPILDTDPSLDNLNYSNVLTRSSHSTGNKMKDYSSQSVYGVESTEMHKEVFQYHDYSKQWEENENNIEKVEEYQNIDQFNYTTVKKYDIHMRQPPVHRQRKILPTVPPKPFISSNSMQKTNGTSSIANGHFNNQNSTSKEPLDIPNQKTLINHTQIPTLVPVEIKETFKSTKIISKNIKDTSKVKETLIKKEVKDIYTNSRINSNTELSNSNDIFNMKDQENVFDKTNKHLAFKIRKGVDSTNNMSTLSVNSWNNPLDSSEESKSENTEKSLKSEIVQILNKNDEHDFMIDEQNKLVFDHLFLDIDKLKDNFKQHSALRSSLFSNVPPYIRFSSHDVKGESFPLPLQKLLKWKLSSITPIVVRRTVQNSGFKLVRKSNDWVGTWGKHMKSLCFKTLREQQKLNHFPGTFQIGRKDRLWKNLHRLMVIYGKDQFGFIPTSYILPQETRLLRQVWEKNDEDKWIVKPPASARGTGIRVISKWNQIPRKIPLVVQRYIDNPYLINDTKFDLRLYILITSVNPLRLYLYDNGLVRFASVKYSSDLNTISDRYMHLTNYSINRMSSQYTQNEDADACQGHKWTLKSLWTYMEKERKVDVKKLWDSLADLVVKTVISGESSMSHMCRSNLSNRYNSYELFGIDVLFDENLKPWILEVNISPSLHSSSPLDLAVKGPLVKDLMNMVGYHIPNKISPGTHNTLLKMLGINFPLCYDKRLYTYNLSAKEREKQDYYTNVESREEYIDCILDELLPDDVRHLISYEDELTQVGSFQKVFPTIKSHKYHQYFDSQKYYNMLFDAWECKYSNKREEGIAVLEKLCQSKVHLEVPIINEDQSKTYDILHNTQMEVEKLSDKLTGDKISDQHQAVISHFSMSAAERRHMVYTSITMSDEGDWLSDDYPFDDDSASATSHPMVS